MLKYEMKIEELQESVKDLLLDTDDIIKNSIHSSVELIEEMNAFTPILKGKKIRSTLFFILSRILDLDSRYLPKIAASIELFHLSSLVHDDIIDNSDLRRGDKTMNARFDNHISVLGGDFLFISSLIIMESLNNKTLLEIMLKAVRAMVEGQIIEANNIFNYETSVETYTKIISRKTSALFGAVSEMASVLSVNNSITRNEFYEFGLNFGSMFQISDDILDIFSDKSGKEQFNDLKEGKITLPYILLLREINGNKEIDLNKLEREDLFKLFDEHEIKSKSLAVINSYYEKCLAFLNFFSNSKHKAVLIDILNFVKYREY